ncbi:(R,R)-butanediol dehydrogenase/meso-butanediol dehydrogenase/diacetyl reductase [Isoptericola jiangsuensis]|uniref:(R,R)-butanediol dehydrogenase/meso-butanediol dehydrogenase/diacetyl reductase n=1 Tax=Isoptericola jiangsuensis TaxID=548579 RepID=A0A2A9EUA0_9MICO|nr:2,3-butanediol dehydrogenase [Isoptericola jiangsuensis]PFG42604.1 (R,R)-butanediol dehydrogenase/meso-butanediol dehydrogenase/diacetyl reductase [Isoptericola jiangsuensis]
MKAAVLHAQEDLRVEDVPEPTVKPGQVKLRNAYAGICGSDLHAYFDPAGAGLDLENPHPVTGSRLPQILGHEFSGTVVEVGEGVEDVAVGDRVAVFPLYSCGTCAACRRGNTNVCRTIGFHGLTSHGGGMAEYTTIAASMVHRLPENVDLKLAALVEPMAVAWHAVDKTGIAAGQSALIAGAGPIGIGLYFALRARGVDNIVVSEPSADRRAAIAAVGATNVVDPVTQDLAAAVAEATGGDGVDVAFDAAGVGPAVASGLASLAPGGTVLVVALHERTVEIHPTVHLVMGETTITGALGYLPKDYTAVIEAMSQGLYEASDAWISEATIDEVPAVVQDLRAGKRMKVLVRA